MNEEEDAGEPELEEFIQTTWNDINQRKALIVEYADYPLWNLIEGIALAFNEQPSDEAWDLDLPKFSPPELSGLRDQHYFRRIAKRAVEAEELPARLKPWQFLDWAKSVDLKYHAEWDEAVKRPNRPPVLQRQPRRTRG